MGRITNILVLAIFCLNCIYAQNVQYKYKYNGKVVMSNKASKAEASIWSLSGKLTLQDLPKSTIMKLDNVKTSLYNGKTEDFDIKIEKDIPQKSVAIMKPFIIKDLEDPYIYHETDDPAWSVNMKKSIGNIFNYKMIKKGTVTEPTIFGNCEVEYKTEDGKETGTTKITKTIKHETCDRKVLNDNYNVKWNPNVKKHQPIRTETQRIYIVDTEKRHVKKIESFARTIYQSMPELRSYQIINQYQEFILESVDTNFEEINSELINKKSSIAFKFQKENAAKNDLGPKRTPDEYLKSILSAYKKFQSLYEELPVRNIKDEEVGDPLLGIYDNIAEMDFEDLEHAGNHILGTDDTLFHHTFTSILPYAGSNPSLKYIKSLINKNDTINDLLIIKILGTLPKYVDAIDKETMKSIEDFMDLKVENDQVKYSGILAFASLVAEGHDKQLLDRETVIKYTGIYVLKFKTSRNYEVKMTHLLGLINMATALTTEQKIKLITTNTESSHLRSLAAYGFKDTLTSEGDQMYTNFWPIVKNQEEHIELRVALLDLLLYSNLNTEQFQNIIDWYHQELSEASEQHLANYFYTTLKALKNSTNYYEPLSNLATEALETIKPLKYHRAWSTGNYRMAYTDTKANVAGSLQARLISNPITNLINVGIFSYDNYALSQKLSDYSIYIRENIADLLFPFLMNSDEEEAVPKLLELLKKNAYKIREIEDVNIEVVIFCNKKAVFGLHINKDNIDNYASNPLLLELVELIIDYNHVSLPLLDYNYLTTDLGTGIKIYNEIVDVATVKLVNFNFDLKKYLEDDSSEETLELIEYSTAYNSLWYHTITTKSYNPLTGDSTVLHKYVSEKKRLVVPFSFNLTDFVFKLKHEKDAFQMADDHYLGTKIEGEGLSNYCPKCSKLTNLPIGETQERLFPSDDVAKITMFKVNMSQSTESIEQIGLNFLEMPIRTGKWYQDIINQHQEMGDNKMAKSILFLWHGAAYNRYIANDLYKYSFRTLPYYQEPTETVLDFDVDTNDIRKDNDPISGNEYEFYLTLEHRKSHDAKVISKSKVFYKYVNAPKKSEGETQPHMEHKRFLEATAFVEETQSNYKGCATIDSIYPSRRTNRYSLEPYDPTTVITKIFWGKVDNFNSSCPFDKDGITVTEIYSASENQKSSMHSKQEYKNCKAQSEGLKYTPPTDDCFVAHEEIARYTICDVYVDFDKVPEVGAAMKKVPKEKYGVHIATYRKMNDSHVKLQMTDTLLDLIPLHAQESVKKIQETPAYTNTMFSNPGEISYDNQEVKLGYESNCHITATRVRTFTENIIKKYYEKNGDESLAYTECTNTTTNGMTIQRFNDKHVGFHLWANNSTIIASVEEGKMKILLNDQEITTETKFDENEDKVKVYFLDNDVIYISTSLVDVFYNTEHISVKIYSIYNQYLCGLCAETENQ